MARGERTGLLFDFGLIRFLGRRGGSLFGLGGGFEFFLQPTSLQKKVQHRAAGHDAADDHDGRYCARDKKRQAAQCA